MFPKKQHHFLASILLVVAILSCCYYVAAQTTATTTTTTTTTTLASTTSTAAPSTLAQIPAIIIPTAISASNMQVAPSATTTSTASDTSSSSSSSSSSSTTTDSSGIPTDTAALARTVQFEFTSSQFQQWLTTSRVQITGQSPTYDQPYGIQATFANDPSAFLVNSNHLRFVSSTVLNITLPTSECLVPHASYDDNSNVGDKIIFRFSQSANAIRINDPTTLSTRDVTGSDIPDISVDLHVDSVGDTPSGGLGVIGFSFALILLLFLLSDWTQATVSLMQLQWIIMISMQTCLPPSTTAIVSSSHWVLWPFNGKITPAFPEYAFRMLFNYLIMLFVLVLELLMIGVFIFVGKDRVTAMQRVRFPSTLGVVLAVLLPSGCMFASTRVLSLVDAGATTGAGASQITYAICSLILSVAYLVIVCIATFTVVSRLVFRDLQPRANRSWFQRLTSPDGEWLVETSVSARWGLLFDGYSVRGFWVFAAFQIISFLFACASGPAPASGTGCSAKSYVLLITAVILAALHVVRKPFNNAMANLTNTIVALSIVVLCVSVVAAQACSTKSRIFAASCTWGALLLLMVKVLIHCLLTTIGSVNQFLFEAEKKRRNNDDDSSILFGDSVGGETGGGDGDEQELDPDLHGRLVVPYVKDGSGVGGGAGSSATAVAGSRVVDPTSNLNLGALGGDRSVPLLEGSNGEAFELRLFAGADAEEGSLSAAAALGGGVDAGLLMASGLGGKAVGGGGGLASGGAGGDFSSSSPRSVQLSLSPTSNLSAVASAAGMRPALANPIVISGGNVFLKREIGFGRIGGLRGSSGPSLVIQLHCPVSVVVTQAGAVVVLEAGFRGTATLARNFLASSSSSSPASASAATPTATSAAGGGVVSPRSNNNNGGLASVPKDAKPRLMAHSPQTRRVEEILLRDANFLKEAFSSKGGNNNHTSPTGSRRRMMMSMMQRGADTASQDSSDHNNNNTSPHKLLQKGQQDNLLKLPTACCCGQSCLFVCDADEGSVVRVDLLSGLVSTVISDLVKPSGVAVSGDILFVSDTLRHRVLAVDLLAGKVDVAVGTGAAGFDADGMPAAASRLNCPQGLFFCAETQELFIADSCNHRIVAVNLTASNNNNNNNNNSSSERSSSSFSSQSRVIRTVLGVAGVVGSFQDDGSLHPAREVTLSMPTQVLARVAPGVSLTAVNAGIESSAHAVEVFVLENGNSRIWHVSRFKYAHVVVPQTEFLIPRSFCFASSSSRTVAAAGGGVELFVVDTLQQVVAQVSIQTLQTTSTLGGNNNSFLLGSGRSLRDIYGSSSQDERPEEFKFVSPLKSIMSRIQRPASGGNEQQQQQQQYSQQYQQQNQDINNNNNNNNSSINAITPIAPVAGLNSPASASVAGNSNNSTSSNANTNSSPPGSPTSQEATLATL